MTSVSIDEHVFRLSAIDAAAQREYMRYGLCFACPGDTTDVHHVSKVLAASVNNLTTTLPLLTGRVRPGTGDYHGQTGHLEVALTMYHISNFAIKTKHLSQAEFPFTYGDLARDRFKQSVFFNDVLCPVAATPDPQNAAVFAVQANFFSGGLIVAICLHHSVGDIVSLGTILQKMTNSSLPSMISDITVELQAREQSQLNDRLSGSRGVKARPFSQLSPASEATSVYLGENAMQTTSCILLFDMKLLAPMREIIHERFTVIQNNKSQQISSFDVIAAILWKAVSRARLRRDALAEQSSVEYRSSLFIPVSVRLMINPPLNASHIGNAEISAVASISTMKLTPPFDISTIAPMAQLVHESIASLNEQDVRAAIAIVNNSADVQFPGIKNINKEKDLEITPLTDVTMEEAHLGLGLGRPSCMRKLGGKAATSGCTVYPVEWEEGVCEVMVELTQECMNHLLQDETLMPYVMRVV